MAHMRTEKTFAIVTSVEELESHGDSEVLGWNRGQIHKNTRSWICSSDSNFGIPIVLFFQSILKIKNVTRVY